MPIIKTLVSGKIYRPLALRSLLFLLLLLLLLSYFCIPKTSHVSGVGSVADRQCCRYTAVKLYYI